MKELYPIVWLVCLNVVHSLSEWRDCPPSETIYPCDCNTTSGHITCGKIITSNLVLKQIFQESSRQTHNTIVFQKFVFQNSIVEQIESETFDRFAFNEISIDHNDYLEAIDENAFKSTNSITNKVYFEANPSIGLTRTGIDNFFKVLNQFTNASLIYAIDCGLTFIPDNAFRPLLGVQSRLRRLSLARNRIKTIGDFAFTDLPYIHFLSIQQNLIESLSKSSLVFNESPDNILIDLSKNRLTSSSFTSQVLSSIDRPFDLQLNDNFITYLNESIFKHLFKRSIVLKLWRNPINCSDCRMKWTSNERLCQMSNNTISYSQRIDFQCKLFKDNFRGCQNDTDAGADDLDDLLPCPLISHSYDISQNKSSIIFSSILFTILLIMRKNTLFLSIVD